ncbi:helix-turn-helix domain-containing protein [Streptomyces sp. SID4919]|uniref:helix-turn-helix domain-containing protein n=1 Tax=unclassified Streptomyces TaxID=2593676 RepID=UPI000823CA28|nr:MULTISPECIES: helix-turn-helix transcriptional regulator [unclassified Streptomyces]MYY13571.1 helix-turn-helix domain-containing protein [Streptomyces sp. SID4919]SCK33132.1 Helix-turn-helix domain-containing protein [Streptomyces sp. AmelKG-E11A]
MPAQLSTPGGRISAKKVLADELSRLRAASGRSLAALSDLTTYDRAYLHKLETGISSGSPEVLAALDAVYGTGRHLRDLWKLAQQEIHPDKYKRFMERERQATSRHQYAFGILPGLLQTKDYMRELFDTHRPHAEKARSRHITVRLARQAMMRGENPQHYRVILDESVLHRPTKDRQVWQDQLSALVDAAEAPHIRIQVLPFSAGLHGLLGESLTLLRLRTGKLIAYLEASRWADLIEEPNQVEQLHLTYDLLRDSALAPSESAEFLKELMKGTMSRTLDG